MRAGWLAIVGVVLGGCAAGPEVTEQDQDTTVMGRRDFERAGYSPYTVLLGEVVRTRETRHRGETEVEEVFRYAVQPEDIDLRMVSEAGAEVSLAPDADDPVLWFPEQPVPPGSWELVLRIEAEIEGETWQIEHAPFAVEISDAGQVEELDLDALDGMVFHRGTLGWSPINVASLVDGEVEPMAVSFSRVESGWSAAIFAKSAQPGQALCRVWTGAVDLDSAGLMTASLEAGTVQEGLPVAFSDVLLRMGVQSDGAGSPSGIGGFELDAVLDGRALDPVFSPADEPVQEGAFVETMEALGMRSQACADGEPQCVRFRLFDGNFEVATDEQAAETIDALPCQGVQAGQGDFDFDLDFSGIDWSCSVVGSAGVGAWMLGVLALIGRRRRR